MPSESLMNVGRRTFSAAAVALLIGSSLSLADAQGSAVPDLAETKAIAEDAFIYGLPLVMNYAVMYEYAVDAKGSQFKAPFNRIRNEDRVYTYQDTAIVTPNSDTVYSSLWLDLRTEPMVISVPAVPKNRYYALQLIDSNTYNIGYVGSRSTGNDAGQYLVAGPDWNGPTPPGIKKVIKSTTPLVFALFRTQLFNPADMPNVGKVQAGYKAQPLSTYLKQPAPPSKAKGDFLPASSAGIKADFFPYLGAALTYIPALPEERDMRAKLARLGVGPGKSFNFKDLSPDHQAAIVDGMKAGEEKIKKYLATGFKNVNGWTVGALLGDRAFFNGDWLKRAAAAQAGIYGNDAAEAVYPLTRTDEAGVPLDASKHNYTITFPKGQLPPVNAFWSVTMYDGKSQLLVKNPINRYLINTPMLPSMKRNADGALTIYIQKDSPGKDREANWLPAPNDTIYLVMRLYWPKDTPPSILPAGSGTWKPPGVVASK